jgi:CSLREA domain-containing protein
MANPVRVFLFSRVSAAFVRPISAAALAIFVITSLLIPSTLHASTITVNTLSDSSVSGDGLCSLREAINNANSPGADTTGGDWVSPPG